MSEAESKKKDAEAKAEDDPFYVPDVDDAPAPQQAGAPKWLSKLKKEPSNEAPVDVKSGAAHGKPPPLAPPVARPAPPPATPENADVRTEKPESKHDPRLMEALSKAAAEAAVRIHRPTPAPEDPLKNLAPPGEFNVRPDVEKRARPALQPLEEGPVEVVMKKAAQPSLAPLRPTTEGPPNVDVVVDVHAKHPMSERLKVTKPRKAIGIVDTTFARFNMGAAALDALQTFGGEYDVVRRTVPGIKDLAVECKILFEEEDCDLVIACGMVGGQPIDKQCAHEASLAIQWCMLQTNRHILEVFVHEDEADDEKQLAWLMDRRTREHAENAHLMVTAPERLVEKAGHGLRQGFDDAGPIRLP